MQSVNLLRPGWPAVRGLAVLFLAGLAGAAQAHTGHGADGFAAGLAHPFGADHLLAMLAVGLWSVRALPPARVWHGPLVFGVAMAGGAMLGLRGVTLPFLELALAASVGVFGLMLAASTLFRLPAAFGLGLVATGALLHGLAHGAEAPAHAGFALYGAGFLITTAVLHAGAATAGLALRRWWADRANAAMAGLGLALGAAGLLLVARV